MPHAAAISEQVVGEELRADRRCQRADRVDRQHHAAHRRRPRARARERCSAAASGTMLRPAEYWLTSRAEEQLHGQHAAGGDADADAASAGRAQAPPPARCAAAPAPRRRPTPRPPRRASDAGEEVADGAGSRRGRSRGSAGCRPAQTVRAARSQLLAFLGRVGLRAASHRRRHRLGAHATDFRSKPHALRRLGGATGAAASDQRLSARDSGAALRSAMSPSHVSSAHAVAVRVTRCSGGWSSGTRRVAVVQPVCSLRSVAACEAAGRALRARLRRLTSSRSARQRARARW